MYIILSAEHLAQLAHNVCLCNIIRRVEPQLANALVENTVTTLNLNNAGLVSQLLTGMPVQVHALRKMS